MTSAARLWRRLADEHLLAIIREHTTPAEYDALLLDANGHNSREAAEFLGISRSAYRQRISRAKRRIRHESGVTRHRKPLG